MQALIPSCSRSWKYAGKAQAPPSDCDVNGVAGYCNEENDDCEEVSRPVLTGTCPDDPSDMCCIPIAPISAPPPSDCDVDGVAGYCNEENDDCEEGSRPVFTGTCPDDPSDICCIPVTPTQRRRGLD